MLDGGEWSGSRYSRCVGSWDDHRSRPGCEIPAPAENRAPLVQPVPSRFTVLPTFARVQSEALLESFWIFTCLAMSYGF